MALNHVQRVPLPIGDRLRAVVAATGDSSYPTGGYSFKPSAVLGIDSAADKDAQLSVQIHQCQGGYVFEYDYTNNKIKIFQTGPLAEVGNGTNLSAVNFHVEVISKVS